MSTENREWPVNRVFLPEGVIGLAAVSPELQNAEGDWWVRESASADKPKFKCKFGFHDWNKWAERTGTITIRNPIFQTLDKIPAVWQERTCKNCGKLKRKA